MRTTKGPIQTDHHRSAVAGVRILSEGHPYRSHRGPYRGAPVTSAKPADDNQETVWQAQGVLMELLGCEPDEADVWLRWRARVDKRTVVEAAVQLVTRSTSWRSVDAR